MISPMEVTPPGTATWPFVSGVYRQPASAPSTSRTKSSEGATSIFRGAWCVGGCRTGPRLCRTGNIPTTFVGIGRKEKKKKKEGLLFSLLLLLRDQGD